jgi:Na+-driven multidrug efflux pump
VGELVSFAVGLTLLAIAVTIYFIPWVLSVLSNNRNSQAIGLLNLFLGWTFIGWVVALIWAIYRPAPPRGAEKP